jgi:hypothetical protein
MFKVFSKHFDALMEVIFVFYERCNIPEDYSFETVDSSDFGF